MSQVTYQVTGGLSQEQIERIHDEALGLIERMGMRVPHGPTRRHLSDFDGVSIEGEMVRFRPDLVQAAIAASGTRHLLPTASSP